MALRRLVLPLLVLLLLLLVQTAAAAAEAAARMETVQGVEKRWQVTLLHRTVTAFTPNRLRLYALFPKIRNRDEAICSIPAR